MSKLGTKLRGIHFVVKLMLLTAGNSIPANILTHLEHLEQVLDIVCLLAEMTGNGPENDDDDDQFDDRPRVEKDR